MTDSTSSRLITRNIESTALQVLSDTPVLVLQGARQTGKSTLVVMLANKLNCRHLTFDDPNVLEAARSDPVAFVNQYPEGTLALDEVQLFPELLRVVKMSVDNDKKPGRFILTGSADLLHVSGVNESLVGRAETLRLYPFSQGEIANKWDDFVSRVLNGTWIKEDMLCPTRDDYVQMLVKGGFPDAYQRTERRRASYYKNYVAGVLDHDAVAISGLAHLDKLGLLFRLLSAQTSQETIKANLARAVGIPESSMHAYIRLLKDLCLLLELPTWGKNISSRIVSRAKSSIVDTGLASNLNGFDSSALSDLKNSKIYGALMESFVVTELFKQQTWSDVAFSLFHFRDRAKHEVDIVIELHDGRVLALEVKGASSVSRSDCKGLVQLREALGERFLGGFVLYVGKDILPYGDRLYAAPICVLWN